YDELIKYKHLRINSGMVILRPKIPNHNWQSKNLWKNLKF
ncbi:restriction endonuclease subunit S, partial [Streptococcus pneumoniae]|nr:restriction endonuclease subunit S [Streptococcus pneumoniae]MDS3220352.1 restriction endonuclease subunit S [Streptococcus pneumoniae]